MYYIVLYNTFQGTDTEMEERVHLAKKMKEISLEGEAKGMACRKVFGDNG